MATFSAKFLPFLPPPPPEISREISAIFFALAREIYAICGKNKGLFKRNIDLGLAQEAGALAETMPY
jgi:hypothetical protein